MSQCNLEADALYITEECGSINWRLPDTGESIFSWYVPDNNHLVHPSILDQIVRTVFAKGYVVGLTEYGRKLLDDSDGEVSVGEPMQ